MRQKIQCITTLLNLQRTYPQQSFMAAINTTLNYGLYDLVRLEKIIIKNIAGDLSRFCETQQ